ncbi:DUF5958 family protein [Streptomyces sp. NPDC090112]|uniref:DUF5958 family protein n=1 Tax=Streptomyces sp. NPDC090112 TaxID=3365949 RepID=UPI0038198B38
MTICTDPPRHGFADLPAAEHPTAFRVLAPVCAVAGTRRRETYGKDGRGHAWHRLPTTPRQP